jgi:zinc transporter 9
MENIFNVVCMSLGMFIITFFIGLLPTKIKAKKSTMDLISMFGAGLLVGAALIVIVPEGMIVLVESYINENKQA